MNKQERKVRDYSSDDGCKNKNKYNSFWINVGTAAVVIVIIIGIGFLVNYILKKHFQYPGITYESIKETVKGFIDESKIIINETKEEIKNTDIQIDTKKFKVEVFNAKFAFFKGTQTGDIVIKLLDEVIELNNEDERQIAIAYKTLETFDPIEIADVKGEIVEKKNYEVVYYYDDEGYLNRISIIKKSK